MANLFIMAEGYGNRYVKKKGLPNSVNCIVMEPSSPYFKSPNNQNSSSGWTLYDPLLNGCPPVGDYKLPQELYLEISGSNSINFDFLPEGDLKFVSEEFLQFLIDNSEKTSFEISKIIKIFNRKRVEKIVEKQYYAIRYFRYDDELIDFNRDVRKWHLFPNIKIKKNISQKIFSLYEFNYRPTLLFTEEIKDQIDQRNFLCPDIYPIDKYPYVYKGMPDKE